MFSLQNFTSHPGISPSFRQLYFPPLSLLLTPALMEKWALIYSHYYHPIPSYPPHFSSTLWFMTITIPQILVYPFNYLHILLPAAACVGNFTPPYLRGAGDLQQVLVTIIYKMTYLSLHKSIIWTILLFYPSLYLYLNSYSLIPSAYFSKNPLFYSINIFHTSSP